MSGPPNFPHNRQPPATNAPWTHLQEMLLQVPNYFPRQPQAAHRSNNDHSIMPTWHTPTTNDITFSHICGYMANKETFPQQRVTNSGSSSTTSSTTTTSPGVDLSVGRSNGNNSQQNGDLPPTTAISLSVRDTNKINSLPASVLQDIQHGIELNKSPLNKSSTSPGLNLEPKSNQQKRQTVRVDSILERLNPSPVVPEKTESAAPVAATPSGHDENSNSSSLNATPEDVASNEDSLDSNKCRRKRKPSKTMRVSKDTEECDVKPAICELDNEAVAKFDNKTVPERRRSLDDEVTTTKNRRKTSSESETIDNIAAMVQESIKEKKIVNEKVVQEEVAPPAPKDSFVEVEDKLEEMFAGIEDAVVAPEIQVKDGQHPEDILKQDEVPSTSSKKSPVLTNKKKKKKLVKIKPNKNCTTKKLKVNEVLIKDVYAYDSGSNASSGRSKGPFIQIRGPRDSPISVSVVNTPSQDEENPQGKVPKNKKFHDDTEYRHKVRSKGLHCSTLSNKYDAQTRDTSWICAFCKRGPHASKVTPPANSWEATSSPSGDLFGPYVITTLCPEFERRLDDPFDAQFKSKKSRRLEPQDTKLKNKKKRKHSDNEEELYWGITATGQNTYEVWAHEECIVWSPGIFLVGPKIVGLEEAVWTSCNVTCRRCGLKGANICCCKRGCASTMHFSCSKADDWLLDETNFNVLCAEHVKM